MSDWKVKQVLIDPISLVNVLYQDTFERQKFDLDDLHLFNDSLVDFSGEHVQVKGYTTLKMVIALKENLKLIKV